MTEKARGNRIGLLVGVLVGTVSAFGAGLWASTHFFPPPSTWAFAHYFRNLYHLVAFIDRSSLEAHEKQLYARIVRAQLSNAELVLLFANSQTKVGKPFVEFIARYALLKVVRGPDRFKAYLDLLPAEAYGGATGS